VIELSFEKTEANMLAANVYSHSKKWNKKKMPSELSTCFAANEVLIQAPRFIAACQTAVHPM
jgi:hypothetical protein